MYKFTAKEKLNAIKALSNASIRVVCRRYKINRSTLWRWKRQFDGSLLSLEPNFSRKHILMPNRQTEEEIKHILDLLHRNKNIGLNELYGKLIYKYNYKKGA